jgi:hypothetical protein
MSVLSAEAIEAIEKHVKPKLQSCSCTVCKSTDWVIAESIFALSEFGGIGRIVISPSASFVPLVVATCKICGFTLLFNAIHVQAVTFKQDEK